MAKLLTAVALITTNSPALALALKEPLVLKPTSPWNVDYADDRCRLARQFGTGDEQVLLLMDRFGPDEMFRLTIAGKPVRTSVTKADASVRFGPSEQEQQLEFFNGNLAKMPALVFTGGARIGPPTEAERQAREKATSDEQWVDFAPISADRHKAVRYLTVGKPIRRAITLETGSMGAPLVALNKCVDNLMTTWGIDTEQHKLLTRKLRPQQSPTKWLVSNDYPAGMLSSGQPAIVEFRLSVSADGVPTACHIQLTTRPKEFDNAVCKAVMRRARFDPALDSNGKPIASFYRNRVKFQLP